MRSAARRLCAVLGSPRAIATCLLVLGLWAALAWWRDGTPVRIAADAAHQRWPCVSYAPSRQAGNERAGLTAGQLRRDLELLSRRTSCVRTYTVSEGFDQVPAVARELGLQVLLGLWIGRDDAHNEQELRRGVAIALEHRDVIRAIVVGNEVLLRHEQSPAALSKMLRRVANATGLPVTYADVWAYWRKHRPLARDVSFVTVHVLPYWDDEPVGLEEAIAGVDRLYAELQRDFAGKPLFVGETGWPTAGRPRGPAVPGRVEQAQYLRAFAALAARRGFDYNVIEAFDQPWKRASEGTVGGYWGVHDADARPKLDADGSVVERREGRAIALGALLAGLVCALLAAWRSRGRITPAPALGFGALVVAVAARQWRYGVEGNLNPVDWVATLAVACLGWFLLAVAARAWTDSVCSLPASSHAPALPRWAVLGLLACASYVCLGLVFAGRHRDFPVWLFLPGVIAIVVTALRAPERRVRELHASSANEEVVLAAWLVLGGVAIVVIEGPGNASAVAWGSACLLLGLAVLGPLALLPGERERARDDADA